MISDHIKRVGSKHWPPYPCKALRLLALMKPLMGSYLNPWMEVTGVWGGAISVDATHTNGQCHIWGEDCVQLASLNKVELHQYTTHNAQCIACNQNQVHLWDLHTSISFKDTHKLKVGMDLKKLRTRALVYISMSHKKIDNAPIRGGWERGVEVRWSVTKGGHYTD